ncbi:MAG TPA: SseB family protein [Hellea balneolensis]|uniref:SseB family protein n=1 Tax=Hellea balneolensis TaxID=287478 RepID=A0A7C5QVE9_9PROT|nr:SseB family protein [Hellea balneolensis]
MTENKTDTLAQMLEQADAQTMQNDPIIRKAFSVALLASDLYVPVYENEEEQAEAGGVNLQAIKLDGHLHVLLFSSKAKLADFMGDGTRYARAPGAQIIPSLRNGYAVLNPGDKGRAFAPEDFTEILGDAPDHGQPGHVHGPDCQH